MPLLVYRLAQGEIEPGARTAAGLLDLSGFERMFAPLAVKTASRHSLREPLYRQIMGAAYDELPPAVRLMHRVIGDLGAVGEADIRTGNVIARWIGRLFGFPAAGNAAPLHLWIREENCVETWTRTFGGRSFSSRLYQRGPLLIERFGALRFGMELKPEPAGLSMPLRRWWIGPLRLPLWLAPRVHGREEERDGLFYFDVDVRLPLIGRITSYRGWLTPRTAAASAAPADRRDLHSLPA
jgi:hypothetical protein